MLFRSFWGRSYQCLYRLAGPAPVAGPAIDIPLAAPTGVSLGRDEPGPVTAGTGNLLHDLLYGIAGEVLRQFPTTSVFSEGRWPGGRCLRPGAPTLRAGFCCGEKLRGSESSVKSINQHLPPANPPALPCGSNDNLADPRISAWANPAASSNP